MRSVRTAVALLFVAVSPLAHAAPCGGFTDVDDANPGHAPFCDSVEWMKNRGITLGCNVPGTLYCPNLNVTRLQMAAFMYRLGFQNAFLQGGNAFGATAVVGTTDNRTLQINVNGMRAMYFEPASSPEVVNIVGGRHGAALVGVSGATIAGGGAPAIPLPTGDPCQLTFGCTNVVAGNFGTIGGGAGNLAGNPGQNTVDNLAATIGGGVSNTARGFAFVGGGFNHQATGTYGVVTGGAQNVASATFSTVAGGILNRATGIESTVGGGRFNQATGTHSTIPGGEANVAAGFGSFAAGSSAQSLADGCFTWADSIGATYQCTGANAFTARASGGVYFRTNPTATAGVDLFGGASAWSPVSDRAMKENIVPVNAGAVLERLVRVPISTWNYVSQDRSIRHVGPMAQDFAHAFGLGESDKHISTIDADGIALAAIQGLNAKLEAERAAKDAEIAALRAELAAVRSMLATISESRPTQTAVIAP